MMDFNLLQNSLITLLRLMFSNNCFSYVVINVSLLDIVLTHTLMLQTCNLPKYVLLLGWSHLLIIS